MKKQYKHIHEGLGFSKNANRAYLKGERPAFLLDSLYGWEETVTHHIGVKAGFNYYKSRLVMFYKKV